MTNLFTKIKRFSSWHLKITILGILGIYLNTDVYGDCTLAVSAGSNVTICYGASHNLLATPTGFTDISKVTYSWAPSTGLDDASIANPVAKPLLTTTYVVTVTEGSCTKTAQVTITVNPLPAANVGTNTSVCIGSTIQMGVTSVSGNTYFWSANPADPSLTNLNKGLSNPTVQPSVTTTYSLVEKITATGCTKTNSVDVTIDPLPDFDFTFTPVDPQCTLTTIQFNSDLKSSGEYDYSWNFGDKTPLVNIINPSHDFEAYGVGSQSFDVVLSLTNQVTKCSSSVKKSITVKKGPDPSLSITSRLWDKNLGIFVHCGSTTSSPQYDFIADNGSTTKDTNTGYSIDWGDGSSIENLPNTFIQITHKYSKLGFFYITFTANNSITGCSSNRRYKFFNGNTPGGNLKGIPNTMDCVPYTLTWPVENCSDNTPGTVYTFSVNDGSEVQTYTQENLPTSISHTFTKSSCGLNLKDDKFTISFNTTNPCGSNPTTTTVQSTQKPAAQFTLSTSSNVCTGNSVSFSNTSTGNYVYRNYCYSDFNKQWSIFPSTGWSINSGSLDKSDVISIKFSNPGVYTVKLKIKVPDTSTSRCTEDEYSKDICVESAVPTPTFSIDNLNGCKPLKINCTNTTDITNSCNTPTYNWTATYNKSNCETSTNLPTTIPSSLANTQFTFNYTGTYSIVLKITNSCGTRSSIAQIVTVKQPPTVTISGITSAICQTLPETTVSPKATVSDCGSTPLTYEWSFPNGVPLSSTTPDPGAIKYTNVGAHTVSLKVTNSCGTTSATDVPFTIVSTPTATISGNSSVCVNGAQPQITFTATGGVTPYTFYYKINNGTEQQIKTTGTNTTATISVPTTVAGTYIYTLTKVAGGSPSSCSQIQSGTATITVNPLPNATISGTAGVCQNGTKPGIIFTGTNGTAPYTFTYNINGGSAQTITTTSGNSVTLSAPTDIAGIFTYNLTQVKDASSTACFQNLNSNAKITVYAIPTVAVVPDKVYCNGVPTSKISFTTNVTGQTNTWKNNNTSIGLGTGGTGDIPIFIPKNSSNSPVSATITVTPSANGCTGTDMIFTITVNPSPTVTFDPPTQSVCSGENTTVVTLSSPTSGATLAWAVTPPAGITGATPLTGGATIPVQTLINSTNAPITVTWYATASVSGNTTCLGAQYPYSVSVNPKPKIADKSAVICSGAKFPVAPANGSGDIVPANTRYTWEAPIISPANAVSGGSAQATAQTTIEQILFNSTTSTATATYKVTPISGNCTGNPFNVVVTVNPAGQVVQPADQFFCAGKTATVSFTAATTDGTTTYKWANSNTNIGLAANGNSTGVLTFNAINSGLAPITSTITVTPTYTNGRVSCEGSAKQFNITINPVSQVSSITNQTVCHNEPVAVNFGTPNTGGTTSYSWKSSNTAIGIAATGTGNILFTATNTGTSPITATITVTPSFANGGANCSGTPLNFTITVNPSGQVNDVSDHTVCNGQSALVNFTSSNTGGTTTYSWTNDNTATGLQESGTGSVSFLAKNNSPVPIKSVITVTPSFSNNNKSCTGTPKTFEIIVNPSPLVNFSIPDQILCSGDKSELVTLSSNTPGATLSWAVTVPSGISGIVTTSGTNLIPAGILNNLTNSTITITVLGSASVTGGTTCNGITFPYHVTVNPKPKIADKSAIICSGAKFSVAPTNGSGDIVPSNTKYTWEAPIISPANAVSGGSAQTTAQSAIEQILINATTTIATATYKVTPISGNCSGTSFNVVVTVNPAGQVVQPADQFFCSGKNATVSFTAATTDGTTTYKWANSNTNIGLAANGNSTGVLTFNTTNSGLAPITSTISVTPTYTNGGVSCEGSAKQFNLTINPVSQVSSINNQIVCHNEPVTVNFGTPNTGGTTSYSWKSSNTDIGINATGTGDISFTANNTGTTPITATITVTPTFTNGNTGCQGTSKDFTITVNPSAQVSTISDLTVCNGVTLPVNFSTSNTGGTTNYTWSNDNTNTGLLSAGNGNISFKATNTTAAPITSIITVTPSFSNGGKSCQGTPRQFKIKVNPAPKVNFDPPSQSICSGEKTTAVTLSSSTSSVTYNWTSDNVNGISGNIPTGNTTAIPEHSLTNSTNVPLDLFYKITATVSGGNAICAGSESLYKITVNPKPQVGNMTAILCSGNTFSVNPTNGSGNILPAGTTYTWGAPTITPSSNAITGATAKTAPQETISQLLTNTSNTIAFVTYLVTPGSGNCEGTPFEVKVTVFPEPKLDAINDIILCPGVVNPDIKLTGSVSGTVYAWRSSSTEFGIVGSGTNVIPSFTTINNGITSLVANISVTSTVNGCSIESSNAFKITVNPNKPVKIGITSDKNNICPGTGVTFTANTVNEGSDPIYHWFVGNTDQDNNNQHFNYIPNDGEIIHATLISNEVCPTGNPAVSNTIAMVVYSNSPATITIKEDKNDICPGELVTYTATPFNEGVTPHYQWYINSSAIAGANGNTYSYVPAKGDVIKCQMQSSNICAPAGGSAWSNEITMRVDNPAITPNFDINYPDGNSVCSPLTTELVNLSPANGQAYIWDFGDNSTTETYLLPINVPHLFENKTNQVKTYTVRLKIQTSGTHCFIETEKTIVVDPQFSAGTKVEYNYCGKFDKVFDNAYPGAKTYEWKEGATILSTALQPEIKYDAPVGKDVSHKIVLTAVSNKGCVDVIENFVNLSPAVSQPDFTAHTINQTCKVAKYDFSNTSPEGAKEFIWDFDNGDKKTTIHNYETVSEIFNNITNAPVTFNVTLTSKSGAYCQLSASHPITVQPEFTAGYPITFEGCSPLERTFENAFPGAKKYRWEDAGHNVLSSIQNPKLTFTSPTGQDATYEVYLIAESMNGCIDTVKSSVIVRGADKATFTLSPTEGCAPLNIQFTNTSSAKIRSFEWNFGDGSEVSIDPNPSHIYTDVNGKELNFSATLKAYNQYGCSSTETFSNIHLLPTPQVKFTATPVEQVYPDRTLQINNLTPSGNWNYTWDFNDGKNLVTGNVSTYAYDFPGDYVISLKAEDPKWPQCSRTKYVNVKILPGIPVAAFEPDTTGCAPLRIKFRNKSLNGIKYLWNFGNGIQSADFEPSTTFYDEGTYDVVLTVTNQFGVKSTAENIITVYPVPHAVFKPLPYRVKIPGQAVTFFNYSDNAKDYLWNFGDGNTSTELSPVHEYSRTGLFNISLIITSSNGCKDTSIVKDAVEAFSLGIQMPNVFTPDDSGSSNGYFEYGDPRNHVFYPVLASGDITEYELLIYNRWGNLIFMSKEPKRGWDGYLNGKLCPQDVYIWKLRCRFSSGEVITKSGDVTLIR